MKLDDLLQERAGGRCELCGAEGSLKKFQVEPQDQNEPENCLLLCARCIAQTEKKEEPDSEHWRCLTTSMWSETPAVQVMTWRMFNRFRNESWAAESLELMYLPDDLLAWAKASGDHENSSEVDLHRDSNGAILQAGDTVALIRSLDVKGTTLNAKMGTIVKNIRLVADNTEQIEGKIDGQMIVILTRYVRKHTS